MGLADLFKQQPVERARCVVCGWPIADDALSLGENLSGQPDSAGYLCLPCIRRALTHIALVTLPPHGHYRGDDRRVCS